MCYVVLQIERQIEMLPITLPWDNIHLFKLESLAISGKYWE